MELPASWAPFAEGKTEQQRAFADQYGIPVVEVDKYDPTQPISIFNHPPILDMNLREIEELERSWL